MVTTMKLGMPVGIAVLSLLSLTTGRFCGAASQAAIAELIERELAWKNQRLCREQRREPTGPSIAVTHGDSDANGFDAASSFLTGCVFGKPTQSLYAPPDWRGQHLHQELKNNVAFWEQKDLDVMHGVENTLLLFHAGHGNPVSFHVVGGETTLESISLGDHKLRYFLQLSCNTLAHGEEATDYRQPHKFDPKAACNGGVGSCCKDGWQSAFYNWRNKVWPPAMANKLRLACGGSSTIGSDYATGKFWDFYLNHKDSVADSFIQAFYKPEEEAPEIPACLAQAEIDTLMPGKNNPLYDRELNPDAPKSGWLFLQSPVRLRDLIWTVAEIDKEKERERLLAEQQRGRWKKRIGNEIRPPVLILRRPRLKRSRKLASTPGIHLHRRSGALYYRSTDPPAIRLSEFRAESLREKLEELENLSLEDIGWIKGIPQELHQALVTRLEVTLLFQRDWKAALTRPGVTAFVVQSASDDTLGCGEPGDWPREFVKKLAIELRPPIPYRASDGEPELVPVLGSGYLRVGVSADTEQAVSAALVMRELSRKTKSAEVRRYPKAEEMARAQLQHEGVERYYRLSSWNWGYYEAPGNCRQQEMRLVYEFRFVPRSRDFSEWPPRVVEVAGHVGEGVPIKCDVPAFDADHGSVGDS